MEWRPVLDYEELYEVSSRGDVRRVRGFWCRSNRTLKAHLSNTGYLRVRLSRRNSRNGKKFSVHRLVWSAFRGRIPHGKSVNHLSGIKTENALSNLELSTMPEQMRHAYAAGLQGRAKGEARGRVAKLTSDSVREIRRLYAAGETTHREIAERFSVSDACIGLVLRRKRWAHV